PFEANFFCDSNGNSTIQMFPFLSSMDDRKNICIEAGNEHPYHTLLKSTIDAIFQTATPIVEFNVFGHLIDRELKLGGLINQQGWREFSPKNNQKPCFPVSFVLLYNNRDNDPIVLLQKRTPKNSGGDFGQYSLISGKVNDEDFPFQQTKAYKNRAYETLQEDPNEKINRNMRLSRLFAKNIGLVLGDTMPLDNLRSAWKNTALRELNEKLGLSIIDESTLKSFPEDVEFETMKKESQPYFIVEKENFLLCIKLFWLEITDDDMKRIDQVRPNAELDEFDLDGLTDSKEKKLLSNFLDEQYDQYIQPFLQNQLGIK
nr:hypothetical protein [Anaerolineaceae bacterium]